MELETIIKEMEHIMLTEGRNINEELHGAIFSIVRDAWKAAEKDEDKMETDYFHCLSCNGPLTLRRFLEGWTPDGKPDTYTMDYWCPVCRLRWIPLKGEPEEGGV